MAEQKPTREGIIKAWKEADAKSDRPVGQKGVAKALRISPYWISQLFAGESLTKMKREHGIRLSPQEKHLSDDELFSTLDKLLSKHHSIPGWQLLRKKTCIPESTWKKKLGGHRGCSQQDVYRKYRDWLKKHHPKSKNIKLVEVYLEGQGKPKTPQSQMGERKESATKIKWPKISGREVGAPLYFGNLIHEPTNEQGVVFLFGMVSKVLGFSIEYIGPDFPDCAGKRYVKGTRERQQTVRIEFEYMSRDYNHPLEGCDIIVCWKDNWKECPLEVIELKSEIERLRKLPEFSNR